MAIVSHCLLVSYLYFLNSTDQEVKELLLRATCSILFWGGCYTCHFILVLQPFRTCSGTQGTITNSHRLGGQQWVWTYTYYCVANMCTCPTHSWQQYYSLGFHAVFQCLRLFNKVFFFFLSSVTFLNSYFCEAKECFSVHYNKLDFVGI